MIKNLPARTKVLDVLNPLAPLLLTAKPKRYFTDTTPHSLQHEHHADATEEI